MKIYLISALTPYPDVAGPVVLYRHFKRFSAHTLKVFTHQFGSPVPEGANWLEHRIFYNKFINFFVRRLLFRNYFYGLGEELISLFVYFKIKKNFLENPPDIILTTWFSTFLLPSYWLSKRYNIPFAIICHDDLESLMASDPITRFWKRKRLGMIYRAASARLCVAEGMEEEFNLRYQQHGDVVYPIGGEPAVTISPEEIQTPVNRKKLTFGYFGSVNDAYQSLLFFADSIKDIDAELYLTGSSFPEEFKSHPKITYAGFFKERTEFIRFIQQEVDICLVAQSFNPDHQMFLQTNFPSKLIDMAGFGLPLAILSPAYSSSGKWAQKYPDSVFYINSLDQLRIHEAINELKSTELRNSLAQQLRTTYQRYLHPDQIHQKLEKLLNIETSTK